MNGGMETTPKVLRHASLAGVAVAGYAAEQNHLMDIECFGARRACRDIVSISSVDIAILFICLYENNSSLIYIPIAD